MNHTNIKDQNIKESSYITFVNFAQKHNKLILDNNRINLKVRDYFSYIKCNINLGFLAKHLTFNYNNIKLEYEPEYPIYKLEEEIKNLTKNITNIKQNI